MVLSLPLLKRQLLTKTQRAGLLDQTRWARDLDWKEIEILAEYADIFLAPKGVTICTEGDTESFLAVIIEGRIAIFKSTVAHGEKQIGELGAGRSFGEMSVIDRQPRSARVAAVADTTLFVVSREQFDRLVETNARVALKLVIGMTRLISLRLRQTSGLLAEYLD